MNPPLTGNPAPFAETTRQTRRKSRNFDKGMAARPLSARVLTMADQSGSGRATWFVIAMVLLGVLIVSIAADHAGLTSDRGDHPRLAGVLGSASRSPETVAVDGAEMTALMGSCVLDLRHAQISPGVAPIVDVFAMMGSVVIRVPDEWTVDRQAVRVLGNVRDLRRRAPDWNVGDSSGAESPHLVLRGLVMMGSIVIRS
jgi:hypothetical protein